MPISYYLIPNPLSKSKRAYTARVSPKEVLTVEDIIQDLAKRAAQPSLKPMRALSYCSFLMLSQKKSRRAHLLICRLPTSVQPLLANLPHRLMPSTTLDTASAPASLAARRSLNPSALPKWKKYPNPFPPRNPSTFLTSRLTLETPY